MCTTLPHGRVSGEEVTFGDGTAVNLAALYEQECSADRQARDFPLGLTDPFALAQYEWLQAVRDSPAARDQRARCWPVWLARSPCSRRPKPAVASTWKR